MDTQAWLMLALIGAVVLGTAVAVATVLPAGRRAAALALVPSLALVVALTLTPTDSLQAGVNLDLGAGLAPPWRSATSAVNILGNLLLFVPLGVVLPGLLPWLRHLIPLAVTAAAASVLVEITQYAFVAGRASDVNDIALNTAGAVAGLVAFRLVRAATDRPAPVPAR
jgi:hypothetical protein